MKVHVFFLTITIEKKRLSEVELLHEQQIQEVTDEIRDRRSNYYTHL